MRSKNMSDDQTGLLITLPARSENVAVVRHAVAGLAEELGMREPGIGDLKTVVTEACMNVVVHAYDGESGALQVEATPEDEGLAICVRDFGGGIRPHPDVERPSLRIGLTLIAALAGKFEISGGLGQGTEVRMYLPLESPADNGASSETAPEASAEQAAELTIGRPELVGPVLARVVGALAARRQITVDRLNDALLFTDAVSEGAPKAFGDGRFRVTVADEADGIDLRIGPLPPGASKQLREGLSLPDVGGSLESLPDDFQVEQNDSGEYVVVRFAAVSD
jgi:anti-sigma regulatory factor (Ser/Thr protein kinase)